MELIQCRNVARDEAEYGADSRHLAENIDTETAAFVGDIGKVDIVARLKPFAGAIQPYGDLMLGAKHFVLKSQIQEEYDGYREVVESNREESSAALSYGWAAGLKIRLNRAVMLEARYERLHGGRAEFVDADSIAIAADGSFTYDMRESRTSMYTYALGLSFEF